MSASPRTSPTIPPREIPAKKWRRARRALRELLEDPDDTDKARDLDLAIGAKANERHFLAFVRSPEGQRLLRDRPSLLEALSDRDALEKLDEESLGRAYLAYMDRNGFDARSLIDLRERTQERWEHEEGLSPLDPLRAWYHDRAMLTHDLAHVVTGYDTDGLGEAVLLAFGLAQAPSPAGAMLTFGAAAHLMRIEGLAILRLDLRAWSRGRKARSLVSAPWESWLPRPLDDVRRCLRLPPA